ncbi:EamA family transporter RarD [Sphingomonas sp. AOB5]|uniref:EamA family transporter RarD n=1 Tax=Sphingomonas sp. AOB5 TaxID=3034017 RepID=UPI0023F988E1|nr:EamA family transporter RarD [Sphingomonas sp. AOB5]MDF7777590.1 EamA family transporter RarD [Sphingomonas sp. AOB5]
MPTTMSERTAGFALGVGAYISWGVLPLYLRLLKGVPAAQVLAHRVLWSLVLLLGLIFVLKRGRALIAAARGRTLLLLVGSATLIGINWLIYIWAAMNGHLLEASLGYFINPLINVALGMAVLGERIRRWQGVALSIAAAGVVVMAVGGGGAIWISLLLATTFALYGLLRKVMAMDALGGLTIETLMIAPFAIAILINASQTGTSGWGQSLWLDVLLALAGIVTAIPLLMFAAAARRMPLSTLGLLQYISPTLQFSVAVLVFREALHVENLITFALIWAGCALYAWDGLRSTRAAAMVPAEH